jgi:hypothetical protein
MQDDGFHQFRVAELVEIEFDIGDDTDNVARLLICSRTDEKLAVELPFSMWPDIAKAFAAALKEFPDGRRRQ